MAQKVLGPPTPARPRRPVHADGGTRKLCLGASSVEPSCSAMPASPASISSTRAPDNIILSPPPRVGRRGVLRSAEHLHHWPGGNRRRLPFNPGTHRIVVSAGIASLRHPTTCAQTLEGDHPRRVHRPCDRWCWRDWSTQNRHLSHARRGLQGSQPSSLDGLARPRAAQLKARPLGHMGKARHVFKR